MTPELKTTEPHLAVCPLISRGLKEDPQADTALVLALAPPGLEEGLTSPLSPADDPQRPVSLHVCVPRVPVRVFHR